MAASRTGVEGEFLTGFVLNDKEIWGRPVGVAAAAGGALLVSEDGNGAICRVTWKGNGTSRGNGPATWAFDDVAGFRF